MSRPEYATQFDRDLDQNVVLLRTSPSAAYTKYVFDNKCAGFVKAPEVVKVIDLTPLYESSCERHGSVFFCRNLAKNQRIFKYTFDNSTNQIHRVQCQCCEYDASKEGIYVYDGVEFPGSFRYLPQAMNVSRVYPIEPKELVDEDKSNFLWIRLYNSTTCMATSEIVVFAQVYPETHHLEAFRFDPKSQKFIPSTCQCSKCNYFQNDYNFFDHGSQGIGFQRTHRDRNGTPLIALAMSWKNDYEGAIEHFSDAQGHIGRYQFNEELKCFEVQEFLNVRVHPNNPELKKSPELLFDNELRVHYFSKCPQLNRPFFYGFHQSDTTMQKFTFNELTHQFETFKCDECCFDRRVMLRERTKEIESRCKVTEKRIRLSCDRMGRIQKTWIDGDVERVMEKAPIKSVMHWDQKKLSLHYTILKNSVLHNLQVQVFLPDGTEKWLTNGYQQGDFVLLMGMDGRLNPYEKRTSRMGTKYVQTDEFGVAIEKKEEANSEAPLQPSLPDESDLTDPQSCSTILISNHTYCTHHKSPLFVTADNQHHLIITKYHLVEVRCEECAARTHVSKVVNGAHIAFDDGYAWRIDVRSNGNFVQQMMWMEEKKEWEVLMEYGVRLMKSRINQVSDSNLAVLQTSPDHIIPTTVVEESEALLNSSEVVPDSREDLENAVNSDEGTEEESDEEESEGDVSDEEDAEESFDVEDESCDDEEESDDIKNESEDSSDADSCEDEEEESDEDSDEKSDSSVRDSETVTTTLVSSGLLSTPTMSPAARVAAPECTDSKNLNELKVEEEQQYSLGTASEITALNVVNKSKTENQESMLEVSALEDRNSINPNSEQSKVDEDSKCNTFSTIPLDTSDGDGSADDDEDVDEDVDGEHSRDERGNDCSQIPESIWDNPPTGTCTIS